MATRQEELDARYAGFTVDEEPSQTESASQHDYSDPDYRHPRTEELRNRYAGYTVDPASTQPDDYGWGITAAFARGFERLRALPDVAQGDYEELAGHYQAMEESALSSEDQARLEEIRNTPGFWAKTGELLQDPRLIFQTVAESLPMMAAPIAGAFTGGLAGGAAGTAMGGPPGTAVGGAAGTILGGAAGSYLTEYLNAMADFLGEHGVNMKDPAQLKAAFEDPTLMAAAREWGKDRGIPIAIFDGLSMGLAGRVAKPVAGMTRKVTGKSLGLGGATEIGMQAGFGMAGEAGAQINTEGRITDELDVLLEGFGEIVPGFAEAGVTKLNQRRADRREGTPEDSPLAALDVPEDQRPPWSPVPETNVDPVTGKIVTVDEQMERLGDQLYEDLNEEGPNTPQRDELEVQLEELGRQLEEDLATQTSIEEAELAGRARRNMQMLEAEQERTGALERARKREETEKRQQEEEMWAQRVDERIAEDEAGAVESEMVSPEGKPVEGEPIDVAGAQPATEGQILPEGVNPVGGRPLTTNLGEALRGAGWVPPDDEGDGPPPPPSAPPAGPDVSRREAEAAEGLAAAAEVAEANRILRENSKEAIETEAETEARAEREAIQAEDAPVEEDDGLPDIPFEPLPPAEKQPAVEWADERLATEEGRNTLDVMMNDVQARGGSTLIPDTDDGRIAPDEATAFIGRTPSTNPRWFQSIVAIEGVGMKQVQAAVDKAKEGKRLGAKQKRIVQAMLDEYEAQEAEYDRQFEEAMPPEGLQTDMMPEPTGIDAQATEDAKRKERERRAPAADMGIGGDLFTGTSDESIQAAEMEAAQTDIEDLPMPEGATMMPIEQANKLVDPNVPLDKMEEQESAYLDNLEQQIRSEGFKQPIEITVDEQGNPAKIFDGNHRVRVAQRMGLEEVPVVFISDKANTKAAAQVKRLEARLADDPTMKGTDQFKTNADAKAFADALVQAGWEVIEDIDGSELHLKNGHSVEVYQNASNDYVMSVVGAAADQAKVEQTETTETTGHAEYIAQLRDTGETSESVASLKKRIEENTPTMKPNEFGEMGGPALVTALRQLKNKSEKDYYDVIDDVLDNLLFLPTRQAFEADVETYSNAANSLVADIEEQNEAWRLERIETEWKVGLDENEIDAQNARIDRLVEMKDPRAKELIKDLDHWVHGNRIQAKTNHERFKQSRKANKYGGVTDTRTREDISMSVGGFSWNVPYSTLTFKTKEDQARLDRILEVIEAVDALPVDVDDAGGMRTRNAYFMGFADVADRAAKNEEFQAAGSDYYTIKIETADDGTIEVNLYKIEGVQNVLVESGRLIDYDMLVDKFTDLSVAATNARVSNSPHNLPAVGSALPVTNEDAEVIVKEGPAFPRPGGSRRVLEEAKFDRESLKDESDPTAWSIPKVGRKVDFGTNDNAADVLQRMKQEVADIGERENNKNKVIISLFDATGTWSQPWVDAGYTVIRYDSARGDDINRIDWFQEKEALASRGYTVYGVLAAPPCTSFSNAGARWWSEQHDAPSKEWVEKKYGKQAAMYYDRPLEYAEALVTDVKVIISLMDPEVYAMENPSGRIRSVTDLPLATLSFDPWHFGDPYTKRTHLWGEFNADLETMPVVPVEGSKMHKMSSGAERIGGERSATPEGFSYSFFLANHKTDGSTSGTAPVPEAAPAPEAAPVREIKVDPNVKGITKARLKRIANNLANNPEVIEKIDSRTGIRIHLDTLWVSVHDDVIRVNSVDRSGIARSSATTTPPNEYSSTKVTHIKEALIALDRKLQDEIKYRTPTKVDIAAAEADTNTAPTDKQIEANNYKKGRLTLPGNLEFAVETPRGEKRHGNLKLRDTYGEFTGTTGIDKDPVDGFLNANMAEDWAGDVYVVDQYIDNKFDEHKVMFGYNNLMDARRAYKRNFNKDWNGAGPVTKMTLDEFKTWVRNANETKKPAANSNVTEEGKKNRAKEQKQLKFAVGKDLYNAPTEEWIEKVLAGGDRVMGDTPDTAPLNVAVSTLLESQAQPESAPPTTGPVIEGILEADAQQKSKIVEPGKLDPKAQKRLNKIVADLNKAFPLANIHLGNRSDPAVMQDLEEKGLTDFENAIGNLSTPALYDPNTGKIWLFKDRLAQVYGAKKLILHEMTHRGLDVMFDMHNDPQGLIDFNRLMGNIYDRVPAKHKAKLKRIEIEYGLDSSVREDNYLAAEELISNLAETDVKDTLVAKVVEFFRKFLEKIGIITKEDAWTNQDIRDLIAEAHGALTGKQQTRSATITEEVTLESTGEVFEVERPATEMLHEINQRTAICRKVRACL